MDLKALFKKAGNTLEGGVRIVKKRSSTMSCPRCGSEYDKDSVLKNHWACPRCGGYFRMSARRRLRFLCDEDTFREFDKELATKDILEFPGYPKSSPNPQKNAVKKKAFSAANAKSAGMTPVSSLWNQIS